MKLDDQLPTALDSIANSTPIDEPGVFDPHRSTASTSPGERARHLVPAAAAVALFVVGGLAVASNRAEPELVEQTPAATGTLPPVSAEPLGPAAALRLPDPAPMQLEPLIVTDGRPGGDNTRWYATDTPSPENATNLVLATFDAGIDESQADQCVLGDPFRTFSLDDGTTACVADDASDTGRTEIAFTRPPFLIRIGGDATEDQLVTAAENLVESSTGDGFEVTPAGLPSGVELIGTGTTVSDFATTTADDDADAVSVIWSDDVGGSIFYFGVVEDTPDLVTPRLGFESIDDITVRGVPGFFRTLAGEPTYLGLVWHEGGVTYQLGSQRLGVPALTRAELLEIVEQFERPTAAEWQAILDGLPDVDQMEEEGMEEEPISMTTIVVTEE